MDKNSLHSLMQKADTMEGFTYPDVKNNNCAHKEFTFLICILALHYLDEVYVECLK